MHTAYLSHHLLCHIDALKSHRVDDVPSRDVCVLPMERRCVCVCACVYVCVSVYVCFSVCVSEEEWEKEAPRLIEEMRKVRSAG